MRAVIYCRYSTDEQDESSITGQARNCRAVAEREDWKVTKLYSDKAMGGNDDSRPQYQQMLADSESGKFDVIICDETSRISRSPGELPRLLQLLDFRNQFLVDTKGFDSRSETGILLASIYSGIDNLELQKIRARTHRGLRERAIDGHWTGGKVYGYTTKPVDPTDPENTKRRLVVVEEQAKIVCEIFTRYADGESPKVIANDLNRREVPSPGSTWKREKRRCRGWVHTAIVGSAKNYSGMLRNETYNGRVVWNRRKSKTVPGTKRRLCEMRPEHEWNVDARPDLRIVDDVLWRRVQKRLAQTRKKASPMQKRPRGRPARYLLSGVLKCGCCDANFIMCDNLSYRCSSHTNGGQHLCDNHLKVRRVVAENVLLKEVEERLLHDDVMQLVERRVRESIDEHNRSTGRTGVADLQRSVLDVDAKLDRVADSIADLGGNDTLFRKLKALEDDKDTLLQGIEAAQAEVDARIDVTEVLPQLFAEWREFVRSLRSISSNTHATRDDVMWARRRLHDLLGDVVVRPRNGVLWAHVGLNAKGLVETRPLRANINRDFLVAGARFGNSLRQRVRLLTIPLD